MATVNLSDTVVAGSDYVMTITLTKDGATYDVTGATVTCTIQPVNPTHGNIVAHAITLTTPASGIVTLTLTDTETLALLAKETGPYERVHTFLGDVKVVESGGAVLHCGPFKMNVQRCITQ